MLHLKERTSKWRCWRNESSSLASGSGTIVRDIEPSTTSKFQLPRWRRWETFKPGTKGRAADALESFLNAVVLGLKPHHQVASCLVLSEPLNIRITHNRFTANLHVNLRYQHLQLTIYPKPLDLFKPWSHSKLIPKLISSLTHISEYPLPPSERPHF